MIGTYIYQYNFDVAFGNGMWKLILRIKTLHVIGFRIYNALIFLKIPNWWLSVSLGYVIRSYWCISKLIKFAQPFHGLWCNWNMRRPYIHCIMHVWHLFHEYVFVIWTMMVLAYTLVSYFHFGSSQVIDQIIILWPGDACICISAACSRYIAVIFLSITHEKHPIARP